MAAILDIESPRFEQPCIYWLPRCSILNFSSIRQAVLEREVENRFSRWPPSGGHIGYRIGTIWTTVILLIAPKVLHQVWCWSVKRFGRRSRKCEKSNGRTDDGQRATKIASPEPIGSGELIYNNNWYCAVDGTPSHIPVLLKLNVAIYTVECPNRSSFDIIQGCYAIIMLAYICTYRPFHLFSC